MLYLSHLSLASCFRSWLICGWFAVDLQLMSYLSPRPGFLLLPVNDIKLSITQAWLPAFAQGWCYDFTQAWLPAFACGCSPEPGFLLPLEVDVVFSPEPGSPLSLKVDVVVSSRPGFLLSPVDDDIFYSPEPASCFRLRMSLPESRSLMSVFLRCEQQCRTPSHSQHYWLSPVGFMWFVFASEIGY